MPRKTAPSPTPWRLIAVAGLVLLAGCDKIPGLGPDAKLTAREAEAKAIGGACRHALRGLEDCYTLNPKSTKAAVFTGWKDMDAYMRENKIEGTPSVIGKAEKPARAERSRSDEEAEGEARDPESRRSRS
jgi:hypothetical protein